MFYGLAHRESEFHAQNIHRVVMLAPCFYCFLDEAFRSVEVVNETIMRFQDYGVYAINGPNWERDLQTLCDNFPQEICDYYSSLEGKQGQGV